MTNKKIVKWLESLKKEMGKTENRTLWHYAEAIDMAIEALSTEAVQAVQDCKNCKHGKYNDHWDTWFCYNNCECSNWDLWESVEVVQHGEWIEIENGIYVCSCCKNQIEALIPPDYCPYCKAYLT